MTSSRLQSHLKWCIKGLKVNKGFTLMELILVIMILGIMATGISGFISLSTQTYVNASSRDELIGNARFVIERLNRELRNAVPNSIRIKNDGGVHCIQFTPIKASTIYTDIPVFPEPASKILSVIPFNDNEGIPYQCDASCSDLVTVYPLNEGDIYDDATTTNGKIFPVASVDSTVTPWTLNVVNNVAFDENSPTQRVYITNEQVSYCAHPGLIIRYTDSISSGVQSIPTSTRFYMAGYLVNNYSGQPPFNYQSATLKRNAVVQLHLEFTNEGENYTFDHEVHLQNVP